jgi:hypothetical protein
VNRIRAYPEDGCYKEYSLFSPGEQLISLEEPLQQGKQEHEDFEEEKRESAFEELEENYEFDFLKQMMGILPSIEDTLFERRKQFVFSPIGK